MTGNLFFGCLETQSYAYITKRNKNNLCFHCGPAQVIKLMPLEYAILQLTSVGCILVIERSPQDGRSLRGPGDPLRLIPKPFNKTTAARSMSIAEEFRIPTK
jgi:hypothetical protein